MFTWSRRERLAKSSAFLSPVSSIVFPRKPSLVSLFWCRPSASSAPPLLPPVSTELHRSKLPMHFEGFTFVLTAGCWPLQSVSSTFKPPAPIEDYVVTFLEYYREVRVRQRAWPCPPPSPLSASSRRGRHGAAVEYQLRRVGVVMSCLRLRLVFLTHRRCHPCGVVLLAWRRGPAASPNRRAGTGSLARIRRRCTPGASWSGCTTSGTGRW